MIETNKRPPENRGYQVANTTDLTELRMQYLKEIDQANKHAERIVAASFITSITLAVEPLSSIVPIIAAGREVWLYIRKRQQAQDHLISNSPPLPTKS